MSTVKTSDFELCDFY